jgi:hypothetical protein
MRRGREPNRFAENENANSASRAKVMASGELAKAIDVVEETYEYMLAYAAQGRAGGDDDDSIRDYLTRAEAALGVIAAATTQAVGGAAGATAATADEAFLDIVRADAARARAAMRFVLARRTIGSQMIDNLNASIHLRALLTDLFLLDEALKISGV